MFSVIAPLEAISARFLNSPRELPGWVVAAFESVVDQFAGDSPSAITEDWYQRASPVNYESVAAAAAYLGAYGPRSFLKIQEAVFALLFRVGTIGRTTRVLDFGSGPCPGYAALGSLWAAISESLGEQLFLDYQAVDRSTSMLQVASIVAERVQPGLDSGSTFQASNVLSDAAGPLDILLVSNVLNEGEGVSDCVTFLVNVLESSPPSSFLILIEPATEHPSRVMCSMGSHIGMRSLGPCSHALAGCRLWSCRQFPKRLYNMERLCLGDRAAAARMCKYSLALLARPDLVVDNESMDTGTIVREPSSTALAEVCYSAGLRRVRVGSGGSAWDRVDGSGSVMGWWPR